MSNIDVNGIPMDREWLRQVTLLHALALEVSTGMKASNSYSPLAILRTNYGCPKATKKGALLWFRDQIIAVQPDYEFKPAVQKAIDLAEGK